MPANPTQARPQRRSSPAELAGIGVCLVAAALSVALAVAPAGEAKPRSVGDNGVAPIGQVRCGKLACMLAVPRRVAIRIAPRRFPARVIAPAARPARRLARIRVRLGARALAALAGRSARVRVRVAIRNAAGKRKVRFLRARIRRRGGSGSGRGQAESGPRSGPLSPEPSLPSRPPSAVDVSDVRIAWHPRDSWIRYVSSGTGPGDGILLSNGATGTSSTVSPCPDRPSGSDAALPYSIDFAPRPSWYDPASGSAALYGQGSVAFRWQAHGIDLTASDPEIELTGAASRAIFRFGGSAGTAYPDRRAPLVDLDLSGQPALSDGGRTFSYSLMRGTLTADGVEVFAGFYTPPDNDEFGCLSVQFTTP